jgi:hypothetical protein
MARSVCRRRCDSEHRVVRTAGRAACGMDSGRLVGQIAEPPSREIALTSHNETHRVRIAENSDSEERSQKIVSPRPLQEPKPAPPPPAPPKKGNGE